MGRLTIDEAIAHAREVAERNRKQYKNCPADRIDIEHQTCEQCAEEHEQLAEWLEELKFLKQWKSDIMDSFCKYDVSSFEELIANARNKAVDDFVKSLSIEYAPVSDEMQNEYDNVCSRFEKIAEQLKAGGADAGSI